VQNGWADFGVGSGSGSGGGSGTGAGYETQYDFQMRTAKLCINIATKGFSPKSCYRMSLAAPPTAPAGVSEPPLVGRPYAHQGLWDTCLTKGYDVFTKTKDRYGDTLALADFGSCNDCKQFGEDANYCLARVRQAGGECDPFSCLEFEVSVQQTCLTVADFDEKRQNKCRTCQHFRTDDLKRYCLFVSDHDCTEDDCEEMGGAPARRLYDIISSAQIIPKGPPRNFAAAAANAAADAAKVALEEAEASGDLAAIAKAQEALADAKAHKQAGKFGKPTNIKKDTPYHMCRQRIWDTEMIVPQKSITAHSCSGALDLTLGIGFEGRTKKRGSMVGELSRLPGANGPNYCGAISAGESIFFIDVDPWFTIRIKKQNYNKGGAKRDTMHSLRWGGACPGENAANADSCHDDSDNEQLTWNNDQWATQRVFFIIDGYDTDDKVLKRKPGYRSPEFEIAWSIFGNETTQTD